MADTLIVMRFEWDPAKERENRRKHGLSFGQATELFTSGRDYLEILDEDHSVGEERLIAVGPIARGVIVVVFTERTEGAIRLINARAATRAEVSLYREHMGQGS